MTLRPRPCPAPTPLLQRPGPALRRWWLRLTLACWAGATGLGLQAQGSAPPQPAAPTAPGTPATPVAPGVPVPSASDNGDATEDVQLTAASPWQNQLHAFAGSLAGDPTLSANWVETVLSQAQHNSRVKRLMTPAPNATTTVRDWQAYQRRLVTPARIDAGALFWRTHQSTLRAVEAQWGVPASVIIGIIGIETFYGQNTGNIRVLDALATLAFDFPATHPRASERARYFRRELEQFLRLCQANGLDPLALRGSFAGAMGIPQFMPSSWLLYGQDYDGNGSSHLIDSPADAIASVANYLSAHGWKSGKPAYFDVDLHEADATSLAILLGPDILPTFEQAALRQFGAQLLPVETHYGGLLALVELKNGTAAPQYVLGTENFYAITRYNQSSYYAMAVLQLGEAVERKMQLQSALPPSPPTAPAAP
ncbi:lytic murein transglycosylase B [Corticibacter populi]|uniref:Lytic murein transglycosylase B n=1 Tax=Corticibacter populi TaxID=1550736 RepID=A0A3M6QM32_9BURK|nr:lytic murein transglycosylase B [Corticibacter populi]RMX04130.1 lytic murein transglycosylase B [Corticibacter populi]RZS33142.1 membrane-bound lytic murein transglycosylase B [Corticibacter populi]